MTRALLILLICAGLAAGQCDLAKLHPPTAEPNDHIGKSVALDGCWAFVGFHGLSNDKRGRVVIYRRDPGGWSWHQTLTAPAGDKAPYFGNGVSAGGGLLIVHERQSWTWNGSIMIPNGGRIHLYALDEATGAWTQRGDVRPPDLVPGEELSSNLHTDGQTIVLGRSLGSFGVDSQVDVFERDGAGWKHALILPEDDTFYWGAHAQVSGDLLVCRDFDTKEAFYAYERRAAGWTFVQRIVPPEPATSLGVHDLEGDLLAFGSRYPFDNPDHKVFVLRWDGAAWVHETVIEGWKDHDFLYIPTVAVTEDRVVVGDPGHNGYSLCSGSIYCDAGAVFVYNRAEDGSWVGRRHKNPDADWNQYFGHGLALDGDTILVGARGYAQGEGAVYALRSRRAVRRCAATPNSTGEPALLGMQGCASVEGNALTMRASPVPDTLGLFLAGTEEAELPWGDGFACIANTSWRSPVTTAAAGVLEHPLDLAQGPFLPGTTWHFQAWFREVPGAGSTFQTSDAMQVRFEL